MTLARVPVGRTLGTLASFGGLALAGAAVHFAETNLLAAVVAGIGACCLLGCGVLVGGLGQAFFDAGRRRRLAVGLAAAGLLFTAGFFALTSGPYGPTTV